jgi:deoxyribonuclease-1
MEANLFNLTIALGEVNGDRSNFNFGQVSGNAATYGKCDFQVDFKNRVAEPRDEIKGMIARTYFYMFDRYAMNMSTSQQRMMMAWDQQYPVSDWERVRHTRVAVIMGHTNPFVTGEKRWTLNHKNSAVGLIKVTETTERAKNNAPETMASEGEIKGNKNSQVYHLPSGCPSYDKVSERNAVFFDSESEAQSNGYRKAGNCTP